MKDGLISLKKQNSNFSGSLELISNLLWVIFKKIFQVKNWKSAFRNKIVLQIVFFSILIPIKVFHKIALTACVPQWDHPPAWEWK